MGDAVDGQTAFEIDEAESCEILRKPEAVVLGRIKQPSRLSIHGTRYKLDRAV